MLILALGAGTLAAFLAFGFLRSPAAPTLVTTGQTQSVPVVIATRNIDVGTTLTPEDVRIIEWPASAVPEGFASSVTDVVGLGVMLPISTNEPVLQSKMASADLGRGLSMLVPAGLRAVSVPVNDVVAVAGWVRPGSRVDVMVTLNQVRTEVEPITQIVLQNVSVLGNDRDITRDETGEAIPIAVVTMLLTPEDAEKLIMAETNGRLQLVLRNALDLDTVETRGVRTSELVSRPRPTVVTSTGVRVPAPPRRVTVEVIRGQTNSESTVGPGGGE
jgi:pilus assembly protein CpaB